MKKFILFLFPMLFVCMGYSQATFTWLNVTDDITVGDTIFGTSSSLRISDDQLAGVGATVSGIDAFAWGPGNTVSGQSGTAFGISNTVTANVGFASGQYNTLFSSAINGACFGIRGSADKYAQFTHSAGIFSALGDAQYSRAILRKSIVHSTSAWGKLYTNGVDGLLTIATPSAWFFEIHIIGGDATKGTVLAYRITGVVRRGSGGVVTLLQSSVETIYESTATFDARVTGDDTDKCLQVEVQDSDGGGLTVKWVATVNFTQTK